jgi:hypothetical protein
MAPRSPSAVGGTMSGARTNPPHVVVASTRRSWSRDEKRAILAEARDPETTVSAVAGATVFTRACCSAGGEMRSMRSAPQRDQRSRRSFRCFYRARPTRRQWSARRLL